MNTVTREEYRTQSGSVGFVAAGLIAGVLFSGWIMKPAAPLAAPAPVLTALDQDRITAAVRAAIPAPAPVAAAPVKAAPVEAAPVKRKVHKVHPAAPAARLVYYVPAYRGCTCAL